MSLTAKKRIATAVVLLGLAAYSLLVGWILTIADPLIRKLL